MGTVYLFVVIGIPDDTQQQTDDVMVTGDLSDDMTSD